MTTNRYRLESILKPLVSAGISFNDAIALRRIAMTLHRWHESECGDSNEYNSSVLVRGTKKRIAPGVCEFTHDDKGKPYLEVHYHDRDKPDYYQVADRERGAHKRLAKLMARYPGFQAYVQGDPRGCALYILRPGDVHEGADVSSCYTNGIAVYR